MGRFAVTGPSSAASLLSLVLLLGCQEAHNVDLIDVGGAAGQGDGDAAGDGDGDAAGDGDGDAAGDGDGDAAACDPAECPAPSPLLGMIGGMVPETCCTDDGFCGADIDGYCAQYDAPGELDDSCPTETVQVFFVLDGCCRADGTCGIDSSAAGLGCSIPMSGPSDQQCGANPQ